MQRLYMQEVATRDGFPNEKTFIETDDKIAFIGHDTPSQILRAGKRLDLHPIPEPVHSLGQPIANNPTERTQ
jgi:hypothetical protein